MREAAQSTRVVADKDAALESDGLVAGGVVATSGVVVVEPSPSPELKPVKPPNGDPVCVVDEPVEVVEEESVVGIRSEVVRVEVVKVEEVEI